MTKILKVAASSFVATAIALGCALTSVPAAHAAGPSSSPSAIRQYFKKRDAAWYGDARPRMATFDALGVAPEAQREIDQIAGIAKSFRAETGVKADDVATETSSREVSSRCLERQALDVEWLTICVRGEEVFNTKVGTTLKWNVGGSGDSFVEDEYVVTVVWKLRRVETDAPKDYTITRTKLAPIPAEGDEGLAVSASSLGLRPASSDRTAGIKAQARIANGAVPALPGSKQASAAALNFDPNAAAQYALRWADGYNPDYDRQDNDCTNFVSQALRAGGWSVKDGVDASDKQNWSPDLWGPRGPSKTWSVSGWLLEFATKTTDRGIALGRADVASDWNSLWSLLPGDIVFTDWGPNGTDGNIDHAMIVDGGFTSQGFREPTISQHTNARRNLPISISIKLAAREWGRPMHYYPVRTKLSYTK